MDFISFGGPADHIAVMHRELVEQRRWICEQRFLHVLNVCMLLPGPEALQLAACAGGCGSAPERHDRRGTVPVILFVAALVGWAFPKACLVTWQGWNGTLATMGFFTKANARVGRRLRGAALCAAGRGGGERLAAPAAKIGRLALDETTPGTVSMGVAWFTFLPSFIFNLAAGPLVKSTHGKRHFIAALTAITAAALFLVALAAAALIRIFVACALAGWAMSSF